MSAPGAAQSAGAAAEPGATAAEPASVLAEALAPQPAPRRLRRSPAKAIRIAATVVALLLAAYLGRHYFGEIHRLGRATPGPLLAIAGLYVLTRVVNADIFAAAMRSLGHTVTRVEAFFMLVIQSYVNLLAPRAGMSVPAAYFKLRRGIPLADFGAVQVLPLFMTETACVGVAGLASLWALAQVYRQPVQPGVAAVFAAVAVGGFLVILFPWPSVPGRNAVSRFLGRLSAACRLLGGVRRGVVPRAVPRHLLNLALRALRIQLAFHAIGVPVNFFAASVASLLSDLMIAVSVTPGAIGFRESAFVYSARLLGTTGDLAMTAALLDRLVVSLCNIGLAQFGILRFVRGGSPVTIAAD